MAGRNIGVLWKPKSESKSALNGTIELLGLTIRISVFKNSDEKKKENSPDYKIVSYGIDLPKEEKKEQQQGENSDGMPF
jgi:uncharacterized protein (DUF736 family)